MATAFVLCLVITGVITLAWLVAERWCQRTASRDPFVGLGADDGIGGCLVYNRETKSFDWEEG